MKFDDDGYVKAYLENGEYPRIHDDIFSRVNVVKAESVIDLGCCKGLLSSRLAKVYKYVLGIEPNKQYIAKAIKEPNIEYKCMKIELSTLGELEYIIKDRGITAIFARRVIPELYETGGFDLIQAFVRSIYISNIEYVIIEGRKSNSNAVNPLKSIQEETRVFLKYYDVINEYNQCRVLRRKSGLL